MSAPQDLGLPLNDLKNNCMLKPDRQDPGNGNKELNKMRAKLLSIEAHQKEMGARLEVAQWHSKLSGTKLKRNPMTTSGGGRAGRTVQALEDVIRQMRKLDILDKENFSKIMKEQKDSEKEMAYEDKSLRSVLDHFDLEQSKKDLNGTGAAADYAICGDTVRKLDLLGEDSFSKRLEMQKDSGQRYAYKDTSLESLLHPDNFDLVQLKDDLKGTGVVSDDSISGNSVRMLDLLEDDSFLNSFKMQKDSLFDPDNHDLEELTEHLKATDVVRDDITSGDTVQILDHLKNNIVPKDSAEGNAHEGTSLGSLPDPNNYNLKKVKGTGVMSDAMGDLLEDESLKVQNDSDEKIALNDTTLESLFDPDNYDLEELTDHLKTTGAVRDDITCGDTVQILDRLKHSSFFQSLQKKRHSDEENAYEDTSLGSLLDPDNFDVEHLQLNGTVVSDDDFSVDLLDLLENDIVFKYLKMQKDSDEENSCDDTSLGSVCDPDNLETKDLEGTGVGPDDGDSERLNNTI